jgi:hypothetical protein
MNRGLAILSLAAGMLALSLALGDDEPLEPKSCLRITDLRNTDIIDDWTIVFHTSGRDVYLNRLPNRCPGLRAADAFTYSTSLNVLCNTDIIAPLYRLGGGFTRGVSCGLGRFEPTTREEVALLKNKDIEVDVDAVAPEVEDLDEAKEEVTDGED